MNDARGDPRELKVGASFALISDIHGNAGALRAVLTEIDRVGITDIICLGDAAQGGPSPAETVQILDERDIPVVMGNADAWLLDVEDGGPEEVTEGQLRTREWTLNQLGERGRKIIARYPPSLKLRSEGREVLCFHGTPCSYHEVAYPQTLPRFADGCFRDYRASVLAGGHTHTAWIRHERGQLFINPGSVGLAYDRSLARHGIILSPWAQYALVAIQGETIDVEFKQVALARAAMARDYRGSGIPGGENLALIWDPPSD